MSEIFERIGCRECTSPDCRGCNVYDLEQALKTGKLDWMKGENNRIRIPNKPPRLRGEGAKWCVELDLGPGDLRNLIELYECQLFPYLKGLLIDDELDNIAFLRSMVHIYDELRAAREWGRSDAEVH